MVEVEFNYNGHKTIIQSKMEDRIMNIIKRFLSKCDKKLDDTFFLYDGQALDKEKILMGVINEFDKTRKKMSIVIFDKEEEENDVKLEKSKFIICPECNECIYISIKDGKISLYECKNGHKKDNISFNEFEKTQNLNIAKIKCDKCKNTNKSQTFENQFFFCYSCKMNLCPLCKTTHNKLHYTTNYEQKDFYCWNHHETLTSYCEDCKQDICTLCQTNHNGHKLIQFGNILPIIDNEEILNKINKKINEYKNCIKKLVSKMNDFLEQLDSYYSIYENIINYFDSSTRNYSIIQNVNYMINFTNNLMKNIDTIIEDKNINNCLNSIMLFKDQNEKNDERKGNEKEKKDYKENEKRDKENKDKENGKKDKDDDEDNTPPLIYDDGNVVCHIVDQNLILQYKDKKLCIMTNEIIKKKDVTTKNRLINETINVNYTIDNNLNLFDNNPEKYFDKFKKYLNMKGDNASTEYDYDDDVKYYCLITKKTIRELNELNEKFCEDAKLKKNKDKENDTNLFKFFHIFK